MHLMATARQRRPANMVHMPALAVGALQKDAPMGPCRLKGCQDSHLKPPRVVTSL